MSPWLTFAFFARSTCLNLFCMRSRRSFMKYLLGDYIHYIMLVIPWHPPAHLGRPGVERPGGMISREQSCLMDLAAFVADATGYHLGRLRFDRHRVREGRYPQHARLNASVLAECE